MEAQSNLTPCVVIQLGQHGECSIQWACYSLWRLCLVFPNWKCPSDPWGGGSLWPGEVTCGLSRPQNTSICDRKALPVVSRCPWEPRSAESLIHRGSRNRTPVNAEGNLITIVTSFYVLFQGSAHILFLNALYRYSHKAFPLQLINLRQLLFPAVFHNKYFVMQKNKTTFWQKFFWQK